MFFGKKEEAKRNARVIDFHSHILPCLDDGSKSVDMSLAMLEESYKQKIRKIVATPHFYPERIALSSFLEKRIESISTLIPYYNREIHPTLYVGAEVAFFPSLGESEDIKKLTIYGTNTLLVEMPFSRWSSYDIESLLNAKRNLGLNIVIAHIERYEKYQKKGVVENLIENDVFIQSNAEFFIDEATRKEALKKLKDGYIQILGSDMHNTSDRPQQIAQAKEIIKTKLGEEYIISLLSNTKSLLSGALTIEEIYNESKELK